MMRSARSGAHPSALRTTLTVVAAFTSGMLAYHLFFCSSSAGNQKSSNSSTGVQRMPHLPHLEDFIPHESVAEVKSELAQLKEEHERLLTRVNAFMNWNSDPYLAMSRNAQCKKQSKLTEYGCQYKSGCPGLYDHPICMDIFPPKEHECIIYDFGIRENPEFGQVLASDPFNCKVFAFDPSPVSTNFMKSDRNPLKNNPNYKFFPYGGGGVDGTLMLNEYNWGQVSIVNLPITVGFDEPGKSGHIVRSGRKRFPLPVKRIDTVFKELGHDHIDVLKVDIEGSEYAFLEVLIETKLCRKVDQLCIEWHHFDFDSRYGGGSSPHINTLVAMLEKECGLYPFYVHDAETGGWPSTDPMDQNIGLTLRFNIASFVRKSLL